MHEWTNEEVRDVFAELAEKWLLHQRNLLSKTAFNKVQLHLGWNYSMGRSLLSSDMAARANLPEAVYYDWMHTLVSSGGCAQYHISQLVRRICSESEDSDASLALMDKMRNEVVWPKASPKLSSLILKERMPRKPNGPVRMFAAETLQMMVFLGLYCQMVLVPQRKLVPEVECFLLMGRILYLLRSGATAVAKVDLLWQLVLEHHDKFAGLYPKCAKIKLHLLLHIPGQLRKLGVNLSCFAAERKHKASKSVAAFAFRQWCHTMLRRTLISDLKLLAQPGSLEPYFMLDAKAIDWALCIAGGGPAGQLALQGATETSAALRTPFGTMWRKDLVALVAGPGFEVGFVEEFLKVREGRILASVAVLGRRSEAVYGLGPARSQKLVPAETLRGPFPYLPLGNNTIFLVASADTFS
jgi:hypothetical protein